MSQPNLSLSHPLEMIDQLADSLERSNSHFKGEISLKKTIVDVQIETQMQGANLLTVSISDAGLHLFQSGFFEMVDIPSEGLYRLPPLEVKIEDVTWRLVDMQGTTDLSTPNVVLEFEPRAIVMLRRFFGPEKATRGPHMTRAEFLKKMSERVKNELTFVCPELTEVQPLRLETETEKTKTEGRETAKEQSEKNKNAGNKSHGFGSNTSSLGLSASQIKVAEELLTVAETDSAGESATIAVLTAGGAESNFDSSVVGSEGAKGALQGLSVKNPSTKNEAHLFFVGGEGYQAGGAIKYASEHPQASPAEIAAKVEAPEEPKGLEALKKAEPQALKIYKAWAGGSGITGGGTVKKSIPYPFLVTVEEDFWAGMTRLAQEVQWPLWQENGTLYFMKSYEAINHEPIISVDVIKKTIKTRHEIKDGKRVKVEYLKEAKNVVSQFTFAISETEEKAKGEVTGKGKTIKLKEYRKKTNRNPGAALTTEVTMQLICHPNFIHAGDVVILEGPFKKEPWYTNGYEGRWVVVSATRSIFNVYTELQLAIPGSSTLPIPLGEPKNETSSGSGTPGTNNSGPAGGNSGSGSSTEGYTNPLPTEHVALSGLGESPIVSGLVAERIDQGVDYSMNPGSPICAMGNAEITGITPGWYAGQPFVWYKLLDGAYAGKYVYVAEQIDIKVKPGQKVSAGQEIGQYAASGTGIEMGWAVANGETYAKAQGGGYTEGAMTAAGQSFSNWLGSLGCPGGQKQGRALFGTISSDYPSASTGETNKTVASKEKEFGPPLAEPGRGEQARRENEQSEREAHKAGKR